MHNLPLDCKVTFAIVALAAIGLWTRLGGLI